MGLCSTGHASTGEIYGYGSRASALGNTMFGGDDAGFATYYNPAANSAKDGLQAGIGVMWLTPNFKDIKGVTTKNSVTYTATQDTISDVGTDDYNDQLGQALGVSLNMGEKLKYLTLGAMMYMPLERVAFLDTGETFQPEYFMYRSRTQRPQIYGSLSMRALPHIFVGTGLAVSTNMSANATILATSSNGSVSHGRFTASIKPGISPYFSIYTDYKPIRPALTVRLPNRYKTELDTGADARALGNTGISLSVVLNAASTLYYDPLEVDLGFAIDLRPRTKLFVEADWLRYGQFEAPALNLTNRPGGTTIINNSISVLPAMHDIVVPKIGLENTFGENEAVTGRFGLTYHPSPVKDNLGAGNLVDPDRLMGGLGLGFDLGKAKITQRSIRIDSHFQYHHLFTHHVEKSRNNELGNPGTKIGAPGYDIGGSIWGGGLSVSVAM